MMRIRPMIATMVATVAWASSAQAATFSCTAQDPAWSGYAVHGGVSVKIEGATGPISVCSTSVATDGLSTASCRDIFSTIVTAQASGRRLVFYFDSDYPSNSGISSCAQLGAWVTRVPYFVEFVN